MRLEDKSAAVPVDGTVPDVDAPAASGEKKLSKNQLKKLAKNKGKKKKEKPQWNQRRVGEKEEAQLII